MYKVPVGGRLSFESIRYFTALANGTACISTCLMCLQDPFGNYVVQYVLDLGQGDATGRIMKQLEGHYPELSQQKFSSNVVEKCLKLSGPLLADARERVIREILTSNMLPRLLQVSNMSSFSVRPYKPFLSEPLDGPGMGTYSYFHQIAVSHFLVSSAKMMCSGLQLRCHYASGFRSMSAKHIFGYFQVIPPPITFMSQDDAWS